MKILNKLKNYILKYPVLFWVVVLTYIVSVIILTLSKRNVEDLYFIVFYSVVGIGLVSFYKFYASENQKILTGNWFENALGLSRKKINNNEKKLSERTLQQISILSNWGGIFGCLACLLFLLRFSVFTYIFLFILMFAFAAMAVFIYIGSEGITNLVTKMEVKVSSVVIFTCLAFVGDILSRKYVTNIISVLPEQVPTITKGLYWFNLILLFSAGLQIIVMVVFEFSQNRELSGKLPHITYILVAISAILPFLLIVYSEGFIIRTVFTETYKADTVLYFKCNNKIIKNVPNDTARYLKVDEQEFRAFYFEKDKSNIQMTTYFCNGSDYSEIDIHK